MSTKVDKSEMFSGKSDGISFEKLDEKVLSWGRRKYGDKYATLLWKNELVDLNKLDLNDDLDYFEWEIHNAMVYDVLCYDSAKYADGLFGTQRFWTIQYQLQTRQRLREKMFCFLETVVKGEAARQVKKVGVRSMVTMRDFLFRRFGAGQPEVLEERVRHYHLGMPDKSGEAFPPRCDMEAKLDALEAEREYLIEMCPKERRNDYEDGKESTLVRIILRHRPKEYDAAVKTVMDLHRFRLFGRGGDVSKITNLEDNSRVNYNTDWLPRYDELRAEMLASYQLQKRRREEDNKGTKKSPGHPTLPILQGFQQPGSKPKTCYGCGEEGHFKGDPACKAGPNEVWHGAPEGFKQRAKGGKLQPKKAGKGGGKVKGVHGKRQRNLPESGEKTPCKFFNSGNGYCKWGDNCRHSHDKKGGGGKRKERPLLLSKKDKKARKDIAALVLTDLKKTINKKKETTKEDSGDEELYNLVRGTKSSMVVTRLDDDGEDHFVPKRRVIMMISSEDSDDDYTPRNPSDKNVLEKETVKSKSIKNENKKSMVQKLSRSGSNSLLGKSRTTKDDRTHSEDLEGSSSVEIGKLERKLEKQRKFIADMSKTLPTYDSEVKARDERRRLDEISRQQDFEGIDDPEEKRLIARAHQQERDNERIVDRRTDEFIASARERAPKKRKATESKPVHSSAFSSHRGFSPRPPRGIASFLAMGEIDELRSSPRSPPRKERSESSSAPRVTSSPVSGSPRKAHNVKLDEKETLIKESLVKENQTLNMEIKELEEKKAALWKAMVKSNNWADHENNPLVKELDRAIEEKTSQTVKVWSILREMREQSEKLEEGFKPQNESSSSDESESSETKSDKAFFGDLVKFKEDSSEDEGGADSEFLIKMGGKSTYGEDKVFVKCGPLDWKAEWLGPFDINSTVAQLKSYKDMGRTKHPGFKLTPKVVNLDKVGFEDLMESERKRLKTMEEKKVDKAQTNVPLIPKYGIRDRVYYYTSEPGNEKWHSSRVLGFRQPEKWRGGSAKPAQREICYCLLPDDENGQEYKRVYRNESELRKWSWAKPILAITNKTKPAPLVPLDLVGIDTCSALSVSSRREDFLWLDTTSEARRSVILRGVGGESAAIGGRGPMVVAGRDAEGNEVLIFDAKGVYLDGNLDQAEFRIFGQQRLKRFGFHLIQRDDKEGGDVLSYNGGSKLVPLMTDSGILALQTHEVKVTAEKRSELESTITSALNGDDGVNYCLQTTTSLVMNESLLTDEEAERLMHWRIGHRSLGKSILNETCPICIEGKKKTGTFKRNYEFCGSTRGESEHYWRLYVDGYGGLRSMGDMSYQGGIGGFVFACPKGSIKTKLYGTTEQFPSILFQVLQEIESEGYVTREIYVDTHSVNLSKAAEEVAAMFRVKIIPVSAGTPQEMAYAESAVRVIGQMGRTLMVSSPHLPGFCWGLADLYATYIHDLLPKDKSKSPYESRTNRKPDLDIFHVKVFGAPCQYAPIDGADHKRGSKTEWGWFVGMQMPMCLVLRPEDDKIISVSRKKLVVHEECFAKFDLSKGGFPLSNFEIPVLDLNAIKTETQNLESIKEYKDRMQIPDHVLSVKSLSDYRRNPELNEPTPPTHPSSEMMKQLSNQAPDPGEETQVHIPEHETWNKNLVLDKIRELRVSINKHFDKGGKVEAIVKALKRAESEACNDAERKNAIKKKNKTQAGVDVDGINILPEGKRRNRSSKSGGVVDANAVGKPPKKRKIDVGDRVKIKTKAFGIGYSKGKPTFTYGYVKNKKGDLYDVQWDAGDTMVAHRRHLAPHDSDTEDDEDPRYNSRVTKETILPILAVGAQLSQPNPIGKDSWPKDFYEALLRDDWREWVQAVKNENDSWGMFEASSVVEFNKMESGASIIPLGELFSVKRNGKYKFRQYALGNMLKEGRDYGETFSSTVSGDGLRWFCALACSSKKEIRGWDATTGYLQTQQRMAVYAYLPSHHGYSDLSFEELAPLRKQLKDMESKDGFKRVKDFARQMKKSRRERPKHILKLNKSIYGIPDAGQSFSMFMQALHLKHCNMVQSEMDPCVFYKIIENDDGRVMSYLVVITWVDDCRFFGTQDLVKEYEETITKNCKCTLEGVSKEFVSIEINHKVEEGILELTQQDYWVKAIERFKGFLPQTGPKERRVPLSPADEKLLVDPSDAEVKAAEHLPYASLLGVCQYPSSFTKLEMRFALSVLSRHRTRWGMDHFKALIKALEYGYTTRHVGLKYNGNLPEKEANVIVGFADSSLTVPRSQGCRLVIMNGAAISLTSKKHTTTDDSTTSAELTELHLCACDVLGFRELLKEIGLEQKEPTIIFQDNQSAIHISMNRGSLSKKTRAMEVRVFSVRNKIEDMKVVPIYLKTDLMLADIGTKALEPALFEFLRDQLCGYAKIMAKI